MVYCHYKSHTEDMATYAYGETIDDMTGELIFHFGAEEGIEIVRKPEKYVVLLRHINKVYGKHRDEFKQGIFKEKIAYEI